MNIGAGLAAAARYMNGSILTLDNIPPYFLPFPIKPERYEDDWTANFDYATSPGSRYQYPIFTGCSPREIHFTLRFDSRFGAFSEACDVPLKGPANLGSNITVALEISAIIAVLEKLKLPKQGLATVAATLMGAFTKVPTIIADPAPPLCLLTINPTKLLVGYFSEIKIVPERYNEAMYVTRFSADCRFLVSPDWIFTTVEDVLREVLTLYTYYGVAKYKPTGSQSKAK